MIFKPRRPGRVPTWRHWKGPAPSRGGRPQPMDLSLAWDQTEVANPRKPCAMPVFPPIVHPPNNESGLASYMDPPCLQKKVIFGPWPANTRDRPAPPPPLTAYLQRSSRTFSPGIPIAASFLFEDQCPARGGPAPVNRQPPQRSACAAAIKVGKDSRPVLERETL